MDEVSMVTRPAATRVCSAAAGSTEDGPEKSSTFDSELDGSMSAAAAADAADGACIAKPSDVWSL